MNATDTHDLIERATHLARLGWAVEKLKRQGAVEFTLAQIEKAARDYAHPGDEVSTYAVPDGPKMLRETLCGAQAAIRYTFRHDPRHQSHIDRLQRLIDECDRHRPIGPDGKHGDRHTPTCGCDRT